MVVGIVLAAGMSTRMGALKQLLPLAGKTTIEVVVERIRSRLEKVYVVVGYRADEVSAVLESDPVECIVNSNFAQGMTSSVKCGIRAAAGASAFLICLGDQPGVGCEAIDAVLEGAKRGRKGIVLPTFQGRRGHPLFIDSSYADEILALPPDKGLNQVTRAHGDDTLEVPIGQPEVLEDMDTPADYQRELARFTSDAKG
ncbi:MAG: molybdenum cofactor cytidylyltransferase [Gemmatimonadetes bacterium]|nr:molybdenum cofactor cytidylyltransferase [Gemmatimonadota bacterium]